MGNVYWNRWNSSYLDFQRAELQTGYGISTNSLKLFKTLYFCKSVLLCTQALENEKSPVMNIQKCNSMFTSPRISNVYPHLQGEKSRLETGKYLLKSWHNIYCTKYYANFLEIFGNICKILRKYLIIFVQILTNQMVQTIVQILIVTWPRVG